MNISTLDQYSSAFARPIDIKQLASQVPAAFSDRPAEHTSSNYVFISTKQLVSSLLDAGFIATQARQAGVRGPIGAAYARHMLHFQPQRQSVTLLDAIPQIVLINSHDGRSAYQLRAGLYRPICTNGLLTRLGDFGLIHVPHRGNVVQNVIDAALTITRVTIDDGPAHLRRDGQPIAVFSVIHWTGQATAPGIRVGHPMFLLLEPLGPNATSTVRLSTPVVQITTLPEGVSRDRPEDEHAR